MKYLSLVFVFAASLGLSSCAGGSRSLTREYQRGVAEGRAQEIRERYWEEQNKPVETPTLERRYTQIIVPAQTLPDGVMTEQHTSYVETVH